MALLSVQDVLDWVPTAAAQPHLIEDAIAWATALAEEHCDRVLVSAAQDEYHDVDDDITEGLRVRAYPVTAVTAITEDAQGTSPTTLTTDDYIQDATAGLFWRDGAYWYRGRQAVRIRYTGGYTSTTVPAGLKRALLQLCAYVMNFRGNVAIRQESVDGAFQMYHLIEGSLPADLAAMLRPYRRMGVG